MRRILLLSVSMTALAASASAQTIDLGSVATTAEGSGGGGEGPDAPPGTAAALAPTQARLSATEPETVISEYFIRDIAAPASDYLSIAQFAPSVHDSNPNGAGFDSKNGTIRGFQDGQYNVTFDGIPFGDPLEFGHATTAFFPAATLGSVVVDRGPGTASTIGNATFGGTISLNSEQPTADPAGRIFGTTGTGNTYQAGGEANFGSLSELGGTTGFANYNHVQGDGLLEDAGQRQDNWLVKLQQPIGASTVATLLADYDDMAFQNFVQEPVSLTNRFGLNYAGLNDDPGTQEYYGNNIVRRRSDFEYFGLQSDQGIVRLDNKAYTYSLNDHTVAGVDQTGGLSNHLLLPQGGVPGAHAAEFYRAWGDIAKLSTDIGEGFFSTTIQAGVWAEHARETQIEQTVNLTTQSVIRLNPALADSVTIFNNSAESDTTQSFIEFDWKPLDGLTIIPGFKHIDFSRSFVGVPGLNQPPADNQADFSVNLGSTEVNYRITPELASYAQWAMGFQAPVVNAIEVPDAAANHISPQQTINYQTGLVWKDSRLVADIDGYYINFRNEIGSAVEPVGPAGAPETIFFNQGGVIYKGIEAEATYVLGAGFSVTGNGSINSAASKTTGLQIANAPTSTADFGVIYDDEQFFGSLLTKYVGHRFAGVGERADANPNVRLPSYNFTNYTMGYRLDQRLKVEFAINNLFDHRTATEGSGALTNPTFYYLPERNYLATITVQF
jgi:iron complex outermembrane recepter protein